MDTAPSTPDDPLEVVSCTDLRALPAALDDLLALRETVWEWARGTPVTTSTCSSTSRGS